MLPGVVFRPVVTLYQWLWLNELKINIIFHFKSCSDSSFCISYICVSVFCYVLLIVQWLCLHHRVVQNPSIHSITSQFTETTRSPSPTIHVAVIPTRISFFDQLVELDLVWKYKSTMLLQYCYVPLPCEALEVKGFIKLGDIYFFFEASSCVLNRLEICQSHCIFVTLKGIRYTSCLILCLKLNNMLVICSRSILWEDMLLLSLLHTIVQFHKSRAVWTCLFISFDAWKLHIGCNFLRLLRHRLIFGW